MACEDYGELISAYIDDELSKKEVKLLLHHLEKCSTCENELNGFLAQKEQLASVRSSYFGPLPQREFPESVMGQVQKERIPPGVDKFHWSLSDFFEWLSYPLRRPAFVMSFALVACLGLLASIYFNLYPPQGEKKEQLMSVYELPVEKTSAKAVKVANVEKEEDSTLFHHIAYSSAETFAPKPSLIEYAAYTPVTNRR